MGEDDCTCGSIRGTYACVCHINTRREYALDGAVPPPVEEEDRCKACESVAWVREHIAPELLAWQAEVLHKLFAHAEYRITMQEMAKLTKRHGL